MIYYIINTLIIGFVGKFPFCRRFFQNGLFRTAFQKAFWVNAVIPRENHERHMFMFQITNQMYYFDVFTSILVHW